MNWLLYAFLTVATWGLYGVYLHSVQMAMGDPVNGRYRRSCSWASPTSSSPCSRRSPC